MTSLAADARAAVRAEPFLLAALRAGVVNYRAAADYLGVGEGDEREAVAAALRRFAAELDGAASEARDARLTMRSGLGAADDPEAALLSVGGASFAPDAGPLTGVVAAGDVDPAALEVVLARLRVEGVPVEAAGVGDGSLVVVVGRRDGATALRTVEGALDAVPT